MKRGANTQEILLSEGLLWQGTQKGALDNGVQELSFQTNRGDIVARYHPVVGDQNAVVAGAVWVGGAGGGLDGPAHGLYPEACRRLQRKGVAGLRLHYRLPHQLEECVLDTLLGVEFLRTEGIRGVALVGHSFGGAVVITAGALSDDAKAVVPISTQTYGTDLVADISPRPLLIIHGTADEALPDTCSRRVFAKARQPKELKLYPGARHGLDSVREDLLELLVEWIPQHVL